MANRAAKSPARQANSKPVTKPNSFASEGVENYDVSTLKANDWLICSALSVVALFVRLFRISQPTSVVFDEVQYVFCYLLLPANNELTIFPQLRWFRFQVHQGQVLHGRPSPIGQAPHHPRWLAGRLRWRVRLQRHRQGLHRTSCPIRFHAPSPCPHGCPYHPYHVLDPQGFRMQDCHCYNGRRPGPLRKRSCHPVQTYSARFSPGHLYRPDHSRLDFFHQPA